MNRRTVFLEVWRGSEGFAWSERNFTTILQFKKEYDYTFMFSGQTAVLHIGTRDDEITRKEALKIATDHVKGNVNVINIDLRLCGSLPLRLQNKKTPHH